MSLVGSLVWRRSGGHHSPIFAVKRLKAAGGASGRSTDLTIIVGQAPQGGPEPCPRIDPRMHGRWQTLACEQNRCCGSLPRALGQDPHPPARGGGATPPAGSRVVARQSLRLTVDPSATHARWRAEQD